MTAHPVARYIPLLIEGDEAGLRELFQGRSSLPHQAAAAVYDRADTGLLAEVRMYDDIENPLHRN